MRSQILDELNSEDDCGVYRVNEMGKTSVRHPYHDCVGIRLSYPVHLHQKFSIEIIQCYVNDIEQN